jgi:hypothetical protein
MKLQPRRGEDREEGDDLEGEADEDNHRHRSGEIENLGSEERKKVDMREEVVKELVETEKKYVKDLEIIVEVRAPPFPLSPQH